MQVGGTIAAVGQRLIDTTAKLMIKRFFDTPRAEMSEARGKIVLAARAQRP